MSEHLVHCDSCGKLMYLGSQEHNTHACAGGAGPSVNSEWESLSSEEKLGRNVLHFMRKWCDAQGEASKLRQQLATQAKRLSEAEAEIARLRKHPADMSDTEIDAALRAEGIEPDEAVEQVNYAFNRAQQIIDQQAELDALKAQLAVAVSALRKIMDQPFQGDWDMQARFVCDSLAKLKSKGEKEK